MKVKSVLLPVLIQDPSVFSDSSLMLNAIHPVIASDPDGFQDGPISRRIAVVDIDVLDGTLRAKRRCRLS